MIATITHHISKGVENFNDRSRSMIWFKTNFNMPVKNYMEPASPFTRYVGCWDYLTETTSYDLTGFVPGYEICVGHSIFDFENDSGSSYTVNTLAYIRWTDPSLNTLYWIWNGVQLYYNNLPSGYYIEWWQGGNIGVADWEINSDGIYHYRSSCVGTPTISPVDTPVTFTNCPDTTQLAADKPGYIWVEGDNLCFICANKWKHTFSGIYVSNLPGASKAGYIWIDTNNDLHWVGVSGNDYKIVWKVKQFASFYSNSSTNEVNAGTSKKGKKWVDNEFGWTHLSYIGNDGYKYLTGAGDNPY